MIEILIVVLFVGMVGAALFSIYFDPDRIDDDEGPYQRQRPIDRRATLRLARRNGAVA